MEFDLEYIAFFQTELLKWYEVNKRDFPWRKDDASNYELIISEILLQRTRAGQVAEFLPGFLDKYPDWEALGAASRDKLVAALKPVGLQNQKGERLYNLAQLIKSKNGEFPREKNLVMEMPSMGQYTTNAYELLILKTPSPLLDVNMARLLERIFGNRKKADFRYDPYVKALAQLVVTHEKSKQLNWAILDYAALICKINSPRCQDCIFRENCIFFLGQIAEI